MVSSECAAAEFPFTPNSSIGCPPIRIREADKFVNLHQVFLDHCLGSVEVRSKFDINHLFCFVSEPSHIGVVYEVGRASSVNVSYDVPESANVEKRQVSLVGWVMKPLPSLNQRKPCYMMLPDNQTDNTPLFETIAPGCPRFQTDPLWSLVVNQRFFKDVENLVFYNGSRDRPLAFSHVEWYISVLESHSPIGIQSC